MLLRNGNIFVEICSIQCTAITRIERWSIRGGEVLHKLVKESVVDSVPFQSVKSPKYGNVYSLFLVFFLKCFHNSFENIFL